MSRGPREAGPIWGRPGPGARRPRFTREDIAAKALEIADAEGLEAVSMRRVASELGAGTMTLYHYVRTKDDLMALMDDAVMREVIIPEGEMPARWREALGEIARRSFRASSRHPWAYEALRNAAFGPNAMRHFDQSLEAVAGLDIPIEERFELVSLIDDYVVGYVTRWYNDRPSDEWLEAGLDYMREQLGAGDYPHIEALVTDGDLGVTWDRLAKVSDDEDRFERGLERLLDGIEADLKRRGLVPRARSRGPRAK
jgi:AcrR family transcriptional regulator